MYLVGQPKVLNKELFLKRVDAILESKQFTNNGSFCQQLEALVAEDLKVKHVIAVCNATQGLEIALKSLSLTPGDVFTPSFTFIGTVHAIKNAGFNPVFVDVGSDYCISVPDLVKKIRKSHSPRAIMPVNLFGNVCNTSALGNLDIYPKLPIIYDSAHALGVFDNANEKYVGNFGDMEVFSLHSTKMIGSGEGGLLTTNDDKLAYKLRQMRNFGYREGGNLQGEVEDYGTNAKLAEIPAALALTNFENIQEITEHYHDNYQHYKNYLPFGCYMRDKNTLFSNYSYIIVETDETIRDHVVNKLIKQGVFARTYFQPCHLTKPYLTFTNSLPITDFLSKRVIALPTGLNIGEEEIKEICSILEAIISQVKR